MIVRFGLAVPLDYGVYEYCGERPLFLDVVPGATLIVRHDFLAGDKQGKDWWKGQVIHCGGAARDPSMHNLFQIADVDSGVIRLVNVDLVMQILPMAPEQ